MFEGSATGEGGAGKAGNTADGTSWCWGGGADGGGGGKAGNVGGCISWGWGGGTDGGGWNIERGWV